MNFFSGKYRSYTPAFFWQDTQSPEVEYSNSTTVQSSPSGFPAQNPETAESMPSQVGSLAATSSNRESSKNSPIAFSASVTPSVTRMNRSPDLSWQRALSNVASANSPTGTLPCGGRITSPAHTSSGGTCPQLTYSRSPSRFNRASSRVAYFSPTSLSVKKRLMATTTSSNGAPAVKWE